MGKRTTLFALLTVSIVLAVLMISCSDMITELGTIELSYDSQGGSLAESIYLERGAVFTDLPTPTHDGYSFGGWYTTKEYTGTPITELKILKNTNIALFAKWTANTSIEWHFIL